MSRNYCRAVVGLAAAALFSASISAQTFDDPAAAQASPVGDGVYAFNSSGYTLSGPTLNCTWIPGADPNDVWLAYVAPATATVYFTVCPGSIVTGGSITPVDSAMEVWDDTGLGGLPGTSLDCQDGGGVCSVNESEISLPVVAGTIYYVQLANWGGSQVISGNLAIGQAILPPAFMTDDCTTAPLASEGIYGYNSTGFTSSGPTPSCTGSGFDPDDCWMAYTPSVSGFATASTCASSTLAPGGGALLGVDTLVAVWSSSTCPPSTQLACSDTAPNCFNGEGEVTFSVTSGVTYFIQVRSWQASGLLAGNLAISVIVAPPSVFTDDCSTAPLVSEGVFAYTSSGLVAGPSASCSGGFGNPDFNDCWVTYTPSASGFAIFSNCASSTLAPGGSVIITSDTYISVWDGTICPPSTELGCADSSSTCFNGPSEVVVSVTVGNTYFVQVGAWGNSQAVAGSMAIALFVPPPPAGPGDDCTVAVSHPLATPIGYNSAGFGTPGAFASCTLFGGFDAFDFWYVFTAPATGIAVASNCSASAIAPGGSSSGGSYLAAWDGTTCPPTTQLTCNNGAPNCGFPGGAEIQFNVVAGSTYYVQVGDWQNSIASSGAVNIVVVLPPANDDCTGAIPIGLGTTTGTNVGATNSPQTGNCGFMGAEVWYAFTVPCSGKFIVDTCGSSFDTEIAVFDNCPGNQIGCNADAGSVGNCQFTSQSYVEINGVTTGQVVYIAVGGFGGNTGTFNLNIKCSYSHLWTVPSGPGSIQLENVDGPPNAIAISVITLDYLHAGLPGNVTFPNGWFFGIPIDYFEFLTQISWPGGLPFASILDGSGYSLNLTLPTGTVSGLSGIATVWSVGVALDPATGFASIADRTDPTAYAL